MSRGSMSDLMAMMLHIADLNAQDAKAAMARRRPPTVTVAMLEEAEWETFKEKQRQRRELLGLDAVEEAAAGGAGIEEDDADALLSLLAVLEKARRKGGPGVLTVAEIVRALQRDKVLAVEFAAPARAQARRLLNNLNAMHRVGQDAQGRWGLLL